MTQLDVKIKLQYKIGHLVLAGRLGGGLLTPHLALEVADEDVTEEDLLGVLAAQGLALLLGGPHHALPLLLVDLALPAEEGGVAVEAFACHADCCFVFRR